MNKENSEEKSLLRRMLPKIVKAVIKGLVWFVLLYVLPNFIFSFMVSNLPGGAPDVFSSYEQLAMAFAVIVVFFVVAGELTSGTIFQHAFNIGKALILMLFIVFALRGGIITADFQGIHVVADLTIYLVMLLTINLVGMAKSVLQAVDFLSDKTESQVITQR